MVVIGPFPIFQHLLWRYPLAMLAQSIPYSSFTVLTAKKNLVDDKALHARQCVPPRRVAMGGLLGVMRFFSFFLALFLASLNAFAQAAAEVEPAEEVHRVLLVGGVNLIQDSDQPKIRALNETLGLYIARGLRDSLIAKGMAIESYIPDQRIPNKEFDTNLILAILKCKCTMVLQTALRVQDDFFQFTFEAMSLKISQTGMAPQQKWQSMHRLSATEESVSTAIPSLILKTVTDELLNRSVFAKGTDLASLPTASQEPNVVTRALWDGRQSYFSFCSTCHSSGLAGSPRIGDKMIWAPRIALGYPALLQSTIKGKGAMAPQSGKHLDPVELERALVYLVNQSGGKFAEPVVPPGHPGTHTYTQMPPPAPAPKPAPYETLNQEQKLLYGERVYMQNCAACHQKNGGGVGTIPPLKNASTFSDNTAIARVILQGSSQGAMPGWRALSDIDIAAVINYMRGKFGSGTYQHVQPEDVLRLRR